MVFSSLLFLFWFIPIFFGVYYICPGKFRNAVLFIGSIVFYAWGEPSYLILIFISILVNYAAGLLIARFRTSGGHTFSEKAAFVSAIVFDFGMLFVFKYTGFFVENINAIFNTDIPDPKLTLPLGISFYTFQIASYVIDLYRGRIREERDPLTLGTYLVMFPQLIAGPIVVYSQVSEELHDRRVSIEKISDGITIFIMGLASKVLIANTAGQLWSDLEGIGYDRISMPLAWLGVLAFTLQIYFDFNGYSLMAIGLGKMLGFNIPQNFDHPYISRSLTEFWRRWHMTLSGWFRDYVYIPLGGNRKGKARTYVNLFVVWFLTGFWHGAGWNFICWGLFFFVLLSVEKSFLGKPLEKHPHIARVYALILIGLSWMIFAITDFSQLGVYALRLLSFGSISGCSDVIYYLRNYGVVLALGCLFSTPLPGRLFAKIRQKAAGYAVLLVLLFVSICYLADEAYNPFLYFRF
ncbi:MAG: MBOAT family protein [Lachnospiraceae bacterium]|nr:MBOAT family protein [Lachnospiraceae bacterium]